MRVTDPPRLPISRTPVAGSICCAFACPPPSTCPAQCCLIDKRRNELNVTSNLVELASVSAAVSVESARAATSARGATRKQRERREKSATGRRAHSNAAAAAAGEEAQADAAENDLKGRMSRLLRGGGKQRLHLHLRRWRFLLPAN